MSEQVAEVLAGHVWSDDFGCDCGTDTRFADYPAHVAEALGPLIAERERVAAERALAPVVALADRWDDDLSRPRSLHRFSAAALLRAALAEADA